MNNTYEKRKDNDSKKIVTMLILVFTLMFCTTGATYAYLAFSATNNVATGTVAVSGLTLTVTEAALKSGNTGVMVPQKEAALGTAMNSTNKCVDGNNNIICKVYTITVSTSSTATTPTTGTVVFTSPSTNLKWKLVSSTTSSTSPTVTSGQVTTTNAASTSAATFATPTFTASAQTFTYYMIIWINETGAVQNDSGSWRATIAFNNVNGGITSTIKS